MEKPRIIEFQHIVNRGASMNIAASEHLPFTVERIFWINDVENGSVRGEHAHKTSKQIVVAMKGKIDISLTGIDRSVFNFTLQNPKQGVYIPPLYWGKITFYENAMLVTFASDNYTEGDYIRNYDEFLTLMNR